jgi:O-antigen ligase
VLLVAGILFAFAGFAGWTILPLATGAIALLVWERPRIIRGETTLLDLALIACLLAGAAQLVPIPADVRAKVAPGAVRLDRTVVVGATEALAARPMSTEPTATGFSLLVGVSVVLMFWSARELFGRAGVRTTVSSISWCGLGLGAIAILTHATSPRLFYWTWQPYAASALPYGPFVNRNDLAAWLVMAMPLTIGYAIARRQSRGDSHPTRTATLDDKTLWLLGSVCLMSAALFVSSSRSGLTGVAAAGLTLVWFARRSLTPRRVGLLVLAALVLAAIGIVYAGVDELSNKVTTADAAVAKRVVVWRFTWQMVRDYWPAGVGLGAYQRGILMYRQPIDYFYVNHAHSEYLQLLTEGGLLLIVPAIVVLVAGVWLAGTRLRHDRTPMFWARAGAVSGMAGLAVQSLWETTLRMPANAVLLGVLAAVAMHDGSRSPR